MPDLEGWVKQLDFNKMFFKDRLNKEISELTLEEKEQWTQRWLLNIMSELDEVLREINWKDHKKERKEVILSNLVEEFIDITKFATGLFQLWGISYSEYKDEFMRKSFVVEQKYKQEKDFDLLNKDSKICGIDLDGVLFDWPAFFLEFIEKVTYQKFETIKEVKKVLGQKQYDTLKHMYRQSGQKAKMRPKEYAIELTKTLKSLGYQIVILTSRPYEKYNRIYADTLEALKVNKFDYNVIFWDKNKCNKIIKEIPQIRFLIEDEIGQALSVAQSGYKVFLLKSEFSNHVEHENIIRVKNNLDLINKIKEMEEK